MRGTRKPKPRSGVRACAGAYALVLKREICEEAVAGGDLRHRRVLDLRKQIGE